MMMTARQKVENKRCVAITHSAEAESKVRNIDAHRLDEKHTLEFSQAPHMEHIFSCGAIFFMWSKFFHVEHIFEIACNHIGSNIQVLEFKDIRMFTF